MFLIILIEIVSGFWFLFEMASGVWVRVLRRNKGGCFFGFCVLGFDVFASMVAGFRVLRINSLNLFFGSFGFMRVG